MQHIHRIVLAALTAFFMHAAAAQTDLTGSYVGILPCADCPGLELRLDLFADGAFHERSVYRERARSTDRVGRWTLQGDTLELRYGHGELRRFSYGRGWLTLLDSDGRPIASQLNYTLNRSSLLSPIEPRVTLEGHFSYFADSAQLEDCATGRRMPVAMEGGYLQLERAWSRSGAKPQQPLPVRVEARIAERVNMEGPKRPTVIVERVVQTGTRVSCTQPAAAAAPGPFAALTERVVRVFRPGVPTVEPTVTAPPVEPVAQVPAPPAEPPQGAVQTFELVSPPPPPVAPRAVTEAAPSRLSAPPAPAVVPTRSGPTLHGTQWRLVRLGEQDIVMTDRERIPYLMFAPSESPRVSGSTGCNRFKGGTTMAGGSILFGGIVTTKMACVGGADIESQFLGALDKARSWRISGDHFELSGSDGRLVARFVAVR